MTRKITRGLARINEGLEDCLYMGNLDSLRTGGTPVIMEMQWRMLQQEGPPEDFVIATGRQESVRRFIELTAEALGWVLSSGKARDWMKWSPAPAKWWCGLTRVTSAC